jgi:cobalt-zinc-cadmium efflux system protein
MVADTAVTAGVVAAAAGIALTGWLWLDPLASVAIAIVVLWGTWGLLRRAVRMSLDAVPTDIEQGTVLAFLQDIDGVESVHDLHIWPISTTETALTAHLVLREQPEPPNPFLARACRGLQREFGIHHATLQLEAGEPRDPCGLMSSERV